MLVRAANSRGICAMPAVIALAAFVFAKCTARHDPVDRLDLGSQPSDDLFLRIKRFRIEIPTDRDTPLLLLLLLLLLLGVAPKQSRINDAVGDLHHARPDETLCHRLPSSC